MTNLELIFVLALYRPVAARARILDDNVNVRSRIFLIWIMRASEACAGGLRESSRSSV